MLAEHSDCLLPSIYVNEHHASRWLHSALSVTVCMSLWLSVCVLSTAAIVQILMSEYLCVVRCACLFVVVRCGCALRMSDRVNFVRLLYDWNDCFSVSLAITSHHAAMPMKDPRRTAD